MFENIYLPESEKSLVTVALGADYDTSEFPAMRFSISVAERGLPVMGTLVINYKKPISLDSFGQVEGWSVVVCNYAIGGIAGTYYVESDTGCVFILVVRNQRIFVTVAGPSHEMVEMESEILKKVFYVEPLHLDPTSVPMGIWSLGPHGPANRNRDMVPLMWDDIQRNYTVDTCRKLTSLMDVHPPLDGGRLILWTGEPGTGKTSAIRSLMYKWLPWCNTSYVVDPEAFFGSAAYMLSVVLDKSSDVPEWDFDEDNKDETDEDSPFYSLTGANRWNLLIIEDADEFLTDNAKDRTGQALSRLLNLSDGLIGQGLNYLVLITTNVKLNEVNKAVSREGRCMANIDFGKFTKAEALAWLGPDGADHVRRAAHDEWTLAQLYDVRHEISQIKNEPRVPVFTGQYL